MTASNFVQPQALSIFIPSSLSAPESNKLMLGGIQKQFARLFIGPEAEIAGSWLVY